MKGNNNINLRPKTSDNLNRRMNNTFTGNSRANITQIIKDRHSNKTLELDMSNDDQKEKSENIYTKHVRNEIMFKQNEDHNRELVVVPVNDIISKQRDRQLTRAQTVEGGRRNVAGIEVDNLHKKSENDENNNMQKMKYSPNTIEPSKEHPPIDKNVHSLNEYSENKIGTMDDYIMGKQIGQGAYAVVKLAIHKASNRKVAVKV